MALRDILQASVPIPLPMSESTPPPRKRRRPALSCELCRRRKIKCDRNYPCGQCIQSKTATCSYTPDNPPLSSSHVQNIISPLAYVQNAGASSLAQVQNPGVETPDRTRSITNVILDPLEGVSSSPDILSHVWQKLKGLTSEEERIQGLVDEVSKLQQTLRNSNEDHFNGILQKATKWPDRTGYELKGTVSKTRYFGRSHWMHSFGLFERISCLTMDPSNNTPELSSLSQAGAEVKALLETNKALARKAKGHGQTQWVVNPNFRETVPPRDVSDQLVANYLRTGESVYRILHVPSFKKEYEKYWDDPSAASPVVILKILLVMSLGVGFYQGPKFDYYRSEARKWVFAAQAWLASPFEKGRLHMSSIQIHCLLLLARHDNAVGDDLVWIAAGTLLRVAFFMGFHRDPKHLPKMSIFQAEMRRRLWATTLELNLQHSLDSGHVLRLHPDDYDTELPLHINDADISDELNVPPSPRPADEFTDMSIQLRLHSTFISRLRIISILNGFKSDPSYDEALSLGSTLIKSCKENTLFITKANRDSPNCQPSISPIHQNTLDFFVRRFVLSIHRPFNARADSEPRFYFSRKICLDSALTMLTYPASPSPTPEVQDDYTRLSTIGGGFFKGIFVHGVMILFLELMRAVEEDTSPSQLNKASRDQLKQVLRNVANIALERIRLVENNVKGYLFLNVVLAQIESAERGESHKNDLIGLEAARDALKICEVVLKARVERNLQYLEGGNGTSVGNTPMSGNTEYGPQFFGNSGKFNMMNDWTMDFNMPDPDTWLFSEWETSAPPIAWWA